MIDLIQRVIYRRDRHGNQSFRGLRCQGLFLVVLVKDENGCKFVSLST